MFLSAVSFPVKVSSLQCFFLAYEKDDYEAICFSLTPHVISTRIKKRCTTVSNDK